MFIKKAIKKREGSILVEALVAISISVTGLLGILAMLSRSLAINTDIREKFTATYLAAEGIEVVKTIIDGNYVSGRPWNNGIPGGSYEVAYDSNSLELVSGRVLLFNPPDGSYNYVSGNPTAFKRTINISEIDNNNDSSTDELAVISEVEWLERGAVQKVNLEDHFFDWR